MRAFDDSACSALHLALRSALGRHRTAEYADAIRSGINITDWVYQEDGKELGKLDLVVKLGELGDAGWDLVSTYPMSGYVGDFGGLTTNVVWTFKRPKF